MDNDLLSLGICSDTGREGGSEHNDFEGLHFIEYGEKETRLSPNCPETFFRTIDLEGKRLVGFKVILSDYGT